jgi:hypothetical protein
MGFSQWIKAFLAMLRQRPARGASMSSLIVEYQIGYRFGPPGALGTRIGLTFEDGAGVRTGSYFDPDSATEALVYTSVLRLARSRFWNDDTKTIQTTMFNAANQPSDPLAIIGTPLVREFDVLWSRASGGWILLRFDEINRSQLVMMFTAEEGERFAAAVTALEKQPNYFIPNAGHPIVRGLPEGGWGPAWGTLA